MPDYTYTVTARRTDTGEIVPVEIGTGEAVHIRWYATTEPCDHTWDMADGCETCGDDHCLVVCQTCGEEDRACDD